MAHCFGKPAVPHPALNCGASNFLQASFDARRRRNIPRTASLTGEGDCSLKGNQHMSGNTDKAAGMANEAAGKVKQGVGKAVGSEKLQGEGAGQEVKGDAQQLKGDAKNAVKDGVNKAADAANRKL